MDIKSNFSCLKNIHYLDYTGAGIYADSQINNIGEYLKNNLLTNPHSLSVSSKYCHDTIDQARNQVLEFFNTCDDEYSVIFTSGTTSGLKSVVEWFDWNTENSKHNGHFVYLKDNHTSVLGLREIAASKEAYIHCLDRKDAFDIFKKTNFNSLPNANEDSNGLFVFPAMCNFSGYKYPLKWIENMGALNYKLHADKLCNKNHRWFCLLDAAAFVPTNTLDLNKYKPDFVVFSFYKIFGYPTGLGVLLVKNSSQYILKKKYYGGGTILMTLSDERNFVKRKVFHEWCEDGTLNYIAIASIRHGFHSIQKYGGDMNNISKKVFQLVVYLYEKFTEIQHANGQPVVYFYKDSDYNNEATQGAILNFNLLRSTGEFVGYSEVLQIANSYGIHLRTGCLCNPGACQRHIGTTNSTIIENYSKGHNCANNIDLIDGKPTGSIRVSLGYMSDYKDIDALLRMVGECFIFKLATPICENPNTSLKCNQESAQYKKMHKNLQIKLNKIFVYPIKSCGAFSVDEIWPLTKTGLKFDRHWMIISEDKIVLTQKLEPRMCMLTPFIDLERKVLTLKFLDSEIKLTIDNEEDEPKNSITIINSKVCSNKVKVLDCGDYAASWLQTNLSRNGIRLVRFFSRNNNRCLNVVNDLSLSNQAQYLLITEPSLRWLKNQCPSLEETTIEELALRFRSNFVVSHSGLEFEELNWNEVKIGSVMFDIQGPCTRCQIISINQNTGKRNSEPLAVLADKCKGKINFGIYMNTNVYSSIKKDDVVTPIID